jgi:hypothetical protein
MKDIIDNRLEARLAGRCAELAPTMAPFDASVAGHAFTLEAHVTPMLTDHTPLYTLSSGYHERIY